MGNIDSLCLPLIIVRHSDLSNVGIPDEKAVILFVTYLCARLMHLNKDIRVSATLSYYDMQIPFKESLN